MLKIPKEWPFHYMLNGKVVKPKLPSKQALKDALLKQTEEALL